MKSTLFTVVTIAALCALAGPRAEAQQGAILKDDIRFARDLARYRFFDLAVDWLADIEKSGDLDEDNRIEVSLAKATISRLASEYALTREARMSYYDDAVKHYSEAIESMPSGITGRKAEATVDGLATVLLSKGKFYTDEIERMRADAATPAEIKDKRTIAEEAFREAVKTLNGAYGDISGIIDSVEDPQEHEKLYGLSMFALYRKGEAYYSWALLYEPQEFNREDYLIKCVESLTDYIWEAGDESIFSLYAYYYQGMAEYELGMVDPTHAVGHDETALANLRHIYSEHGIIVDQLPTLMDEERRFVQGLLEQAYGGVCQLYRSAAKRIESSQTISDEEDLTGVAQSYLVVGKEDWMAKPPVYRAALVEALRAAALSSIDELERRLAQHKIPWTEAGYRALLEKARTLSDMARLPDAAVIVKLVADNNEGNPVGIEATRMMSDLFGDQEGFGGAQPPAVLRLAANGSIQEGRWLEAIGTLHRLIGACQTPEEQLAHVPTAWKDIGQCYQSLSRNLEAAIAFEAGFEAANALKDEVSVGDLALDAYGAWDRRFRETKHEFDKNERNRVRNIVTRLGISGDVQFLVGREAFSNAAGTADREARKQAYETAVAELKKVDADSSYYERALVLLARAYDGAGKPQEALKQFDALLTRIETVNVTLDRKKSQQRKLAHPEAVFYRAGVLIDLQRFEEVFDSLAGYESKFEGQEAYFPNVFYYRIKAKVGLKQLDEAEKLFGKMEADYPKHQSITYALLQLSTGHFDAYNALAEEDRKAEAGQAHLLSAAEYLARYNKLTGYASFSNLQNVADWYKEIGELKLAEENYRLLYNKYGKDPAQQKNIDRDVRRKFAEVLLELHEFQDALPLWAAEYAAKRKDRSTVRAYALCLGGWLEEKQDGVMMFEYESIPGAGQYQEAMAKWLELKEGIEDAEDKGKDPWWECMLNYLFCQYMAAQTDPQQKAAGLRLIQNWEALHPDLGGEPWKRRIRFLKRQLQK